MTNISRWDPLDDLFRGFFVRPVEFSSQLAEAPSIKIDVKENAEGFAVHAELPGIKKEDIHVSIDGAVVSVSAERRQEKETKEGERILRSERYFGKVPRRPQLASEIDEANATAKFNEGVLELTLPKKTSAPSRRLSIE